MLGKDVQSGKWHAWTMASPNGAYYEIHDTRGLEAGKSLLVGFKGIVVTDGYGVYDALERRMPGLRIAQCWVQIRRGFVNCQSAFPKETEDHRLGALDRVARELNRRRRKTLGFATPADTLNVDVALTG